VAPSIAEAGRVELEPVRIASLSRGATVHTVFSFQVVKNSYLKFIPSFSRVRSYRNGVVIFNLIYRIYISSIVE